MKNKLIEAQIGGAIFMVNELLRFIGQGTIEN